MKLTHLLIAFLLTAHSAISQPAAFLNKAAWHAQWQAEETADNPFNPGYRSQYLRMKKDASGNIPRLPYLAISAHEQAAVNRESQLFYTEEVGPKNYGGRTRAILLDADNSSHIFAAGISGGIWFSSDSGVHWIPVNDHLGSLAVSSLVQDYFNHDIVYAGTGEAAGNSANIPGNGIYKSTDHGVTFGQLPSTDGSVFDFIPRIATSPIDSNGLYVATAGGGLYRSVDGGESMNKIFSTSAAINDLEITPSGKVWIGINGAGLFYSSTGDSGTFVQSMDGLPAAGSFARIEIAQALSDTNVLYAAFEKSGGGYYSGIKGIYRSADGGATWTVTGNPDIDFGFYMAFPWYSMSMAVKPDDPDFIVFGVGDVTYSSDGGMVWKKCINIHVDHHFTVFNPDKPTRLYQGNDGGVYRMRTDQIAYNQTPLNKGYNTIQYYAGSFFPSGINALAGAQDNGTHYAIAGNGTFNEVFGGDGAYNAVNQQYPNIAYVSYQEGTIHRADDADYEYPNFYPVLGAMDSDNDGDIDDGAWFINPFEINLVNGDQLLFATQKRVWQSLDGGFAWEPAMNSLAGTVSPYAIGISRDFDATIYIGGESAIFYRIDEGYNAIPGTESNLSASVPAAVTSDFISNIVVHPDDKSICYVSFSNFSDEPRIWRVTQATSSTPVWTPVSGDLPTGLPVNYVDIDPLRPDEFLLAGTDYGLYVSTDGGAHWVKDANIPNVVVQQVKVRPTDRRVFIFTHGRGLWTSVLDTNNVAVADIGSSEAFASVYPNPFESSFIVKSNTPNWDATLFDVNGRCVLEGHTLRSNQPVEPADLLPGIYFLQLRSDQGTIMKKLVKK